MKTIIGVFLALTAVSAPLSADDARPTNSEETASAAPAPTQDQTELGPTLALNISVDHNSSAPQCRTDNDCGNGRTCADGVCKTPIAKWRKGVEIEPRFGFGICVAKDQRCWGVSANLNPGVGGGMFLGIRFIPFVAVGADLGLYTFTNKSDNPGEDPYRILSNAMLQVRGYLPLGLKKQGFGDAYLKFSAGYLSLKEKAQVGYVSKVYSPMNFAFGIGLTGFFAQDSAVGDIGGGLVFDYIFFEPTKCSIDSLTSDDDLTSDECSVEELQEVEIAQFHSIQISLHFKWVIPVFPW